jgi:hypothetical protein
MKPEQKKDFKGTIKQKGNDLYDKYVPAEIKGMFEKKSGVNDDLSYTANSEYFG